MYIPLVEHRIDQAFKTSGAGTNSSVAVESAQSRRGDSPLSLAEGFLGAEPGRIIGDDEAFLGTPGDAPLGGTGAGVGVKQTMSTTPISTDSLLRSFTWPEPPSPPAPGEVSDASRNPNDPAGSPAAGVSKPGATTAAPTAAQGSSHGLTAAAANTGTSKNAPIAREAAPG
jgi:hypothetical protein